MTIKEFKPMLASPANFDILRYPLLASPKLDGIRAMVRGGRLVSRKLLDIPNKEIQAALARPEFEGLDGELIVGEPTATDVYNRTVSFVMAGSKTGEPWTYFVFDMHDIPDTTYEFRAAEVDGVVEKSDDGRLTSWVSRIITERMHLDTFEAECIELGYEGIMLRDPQAEYKHGRSTAREQHLLKVKRFEDSEAEVIGIQEEQHNGNDAGRDELGRTKRSTAKAGKTGKGTMGALIVKDCSTGVEFNIGTGFTAAMRAQTWNIGDVVTYKFFPVGVVDKPRHPVFKGMRNRIDMGAPA
jgi:DNA ligase-1